MKILKNKLALAGVCIVVALLITFVGAPVAELFTSRNVTVTRAKSIIKMGEMLQENMIETVDVGKFNLPPDTLAEKALVIGKYAKCDIQPGDYVTASKTSENIPLENEYLHRLSDGKVAISIELSTSSAALSGKLRADDIVSIYALPANQASTGETLEGEAAREKMIEASFALAPKELKYVKILAVTNEAEKDIASDNSGLIENTGEQQVAAMKTIQTITVEANDEQAALLAGLNGTNRLHVALVARGVKEKSEELLTEQNKFFDK